MSGPARGLAWQPTGNVIFTPVPFKLLRVVRHHDGNEYVGADMGEYTGHFFDPWKRGDLVVLERGVSATYQQGKGTERWTTWHVGRRTTTPSAPNLKLDLGCAPYTIAHADILYRISYRYQASAVLLIGQEFKTRKELESMLA